MKENIKITIIGLAAMIVFGAGIVFSVLKMSETKQGHRDKIESNITYLEEPVNY